MTRRKSRPVPGQQAMFAESTAATASRHPWKLSPLQRWTGRAGVAAARAVLHARRPAA